MSMDKMGINWRYDTLVLVVSTWLLGLFSLGVLVRQLKVNNLANRATLERVATQIIEANSSERLLIQQANEIQVRQRAINDNLDDNLVKLKELHAALQREAGKRKEKNE
jgi:hypothetical protein